MTSKNNRCSTRKTRGNTLIFVLVSFGVLALALIVGYSYCGLYFIHNRLQASADELALVGAKKLNDRDRLGQLNNMIARSRQLVHSTREDYDKTKKDYPNLESFVQPLLQEARDSAMQLETERVNVNVLAKAEAATAMQQRYQELKPTYPMVLPWLKVKSLQVKQVSFGKIDGMESNVEELTQLQKLQDQDRLNNNVVRLGGINLYAAEKDHQLSATDDSDLHFNLSSLPAPLDGTIAPARVILPKTYTVTKPGYAPSAAQVELQISVESGLGFPVSSAMTATGYASTTGASQQL